MDLGVHSGDLLVTLADGSLARSETVVIATGVTYRRLDVPRLDELLGAGVFYGAAGEAAALKGQRAFVVGGANSAGQAAVHLARFASHVTLLVRGPSLASMSTYLIHEMERASNISVWHNATVTGVRGRAASKPFRCETRQPAGTESADGLFVLIGAHPHSDWLADVVERDSQGFCSPILILPTGHWTDHHSRKRPAFPVYSLLATYGTVR